MSKIPPTPTGVHKEAIINQEEYAPDSDMRLLKDIIAATGISRLAWLENCTTNLFFEILWTSWSHVRSRGTSAKLAENSFRSSMTVFKKKNGMKSRTRSITLPASLQRNGSDPNLTRWIHLSMRLDVRRARRTVGFGFTEFGIRASVGASF
jgi:hypothetical protein